MGCAIITTSTVTCLDMNPPDEVLGPIRDVHVHVYMDSTVQYDM